VVTAEPAEYGVTGRVVDSEYGWIELAVVEHAFVALFLVEYAVTDLTVFPTAVALLTAV
jgi:hypothetical protein